MGILTDETQRGRLISLLVKHCDRLCVLLYVVGLVGFLLQAYQPMNAATYFSENALLPGLVESELPRTLSSAESYKTELEDLMKKEPSSSQRIWIFEKFKKMGLETYTQNFSVIYPFRSISKKVVSGENVYSILRARRAASTEAVVLSVPLRPLANKAKTAAGGGVALALALAEEFKQKPYWSKDIIFLFSEFDELGAMAWLDGYHQTESQYILANDLEGRSGPIIAALNLELPLSNVNYFNVKVEGLNGQLPNLDLVNLVIRLCRRERVQVRLHDCLEDTGYIRSEYGDSLQDYKRSLTTMLKMMWYQASGAPSGNHGLFQKFHIESVSLEGVAKKSSYSVDLSTTARIMEALWAGPEKNCEEKKTDNNKSTDNTEDESKKVEDVTDEGEKACLSDEAKEVKNKQEVDGAECTEGDTSDIKKVDSKASKENNTDFIEEESVSGKGLISIVPVLLVTMLLGWMASQGPELLTHIMPRFRIQTEDMILFSLLAIFMSALSYPKLMKKKGGDSNILSLDWQLLKSVALILQTLALASLALFNISLSFFLTAAMVPVTVAVRPTANRCLRWLQMLALLIISPLSLLYIAGIISSWPKSSPLELLLEAYSSCKELIFLGVMDTHLFNAWTETVLTAFIFPIWLLFWAVPWIDVPSKK
ncbi:Glycosylphosphatidylinositol anchor attachment 1 protein [Bulinus truncatus]|nr:Glycosylphosphatidylinositol anchor attachment 1 protein [Bulinus truncatus]